MKTNRRILVVDDDPVVGRSIERALTSKGYAVINCSNGKDALAKLQNEEYDAVFTDLKMPEMGGLEVAAKVKASQPWMPVVIVTGYATEQAQNEAKACGVTQFIQKPLSSEMIENMAEDAMREKQAINVVLDVGVDLNETPVIAEPLPQVQNENFMFNIALFLAAPFIGLLYALALPFVGMGMLMTIAFKAAMKNEKVRFYSTLVAAPFIGLAFAVAMPIVGLFTLVYMGYQTALRE
jgi:CheY-like chemotaxis protein